LRVVSVLLETYTMDSWIPPLDDRDGIVGAMGLAHYQHRPLHCQKFVRTEKVHHGP